MSPLLSEWYFGISLLSVVLALMNAESGCLKNVGMGLHICRSNFDCQVLPRTAWRYWKY